MNEHIIAGFMDEMEKESGKVKKTILNLKNRYYLRKWNRASSRKTKAGAKQYKYGLKADAADAKAGDAYSKLNRVRDAIAAQPR